METSTWLEWRKNLISPYYTRKNLEIVLGSNRRTLDYRIKKLIREGIFETIKPGFYLNRDLFLRTAEKEAFVEYIGTIIKYPAYVSLEYALSKYGLITEGIYTITCITTKKPGKYKSYNFSFSYRNIKPSLFSDYEERYYNGAKYFYAKNYKALFDFIYLTSLKKASDFEQLLFNSRLNWNALSQDEKKSFVSICTASGSKKMVRIVTLLQKEKLL